jgi:hypothetical protein
MRIQALHLRLSKGEMRHKASSVEKINIPAIKSSQLLTSLLHSFGVLSTDSWVTFHHSAKRDGQKFRTITQSSSLTCLHKITYPVCEGSMVLKSLLGFGIWKTQG